MKISFLTTYRGTDEQRLFNLKRVIRSIRTDFPDWEVIVVEQSEKATLMAHSFIENISYTHAYNPGAFNKSWGMNVAYTQSSGDILVVCDADIILRREDLQRAVSACEKELDAVRPYGKLIDMNKEQTDAFFDTAELCSEPDEARGFDRQHVFEALCFAGGAFVVRRDYFSRTGGMDERFSGWGGEDDAMSIKLTSMSKKVAISKNAIAWHLWHQRADRDEHGSYRRNWQLLQQYQAISEHERASFYTAQSDIGDVNKYHYERPPSIEKIKNPQALDANDILSLLPSGYGTVQLSGNANLQRKFGIVIPSCGRPEYLKRSLQSLAESNLSQAVICIVDETVADKQELTGFTCFEGIDSVGKDIDELRQPFEYIKQIAERMPDCNLFNDMGHLKKAIQPLTELKPMYSRHGLYIRDLYLDANPGLKESLTPLCSKQDGEAEKFIRDFMIPDIPVIKIFKALHGNMFDSLRTGWDLLQAIDCDYLVCLDADTIVQKNWLRRLEITHRLYKKKNEVPGLITTGFNSSYHADLSGEKKYVIKESVGGINLFFQQDAYRDLIRPSLIDVYWDHRLSNWLMDECVPVVATVPSVVQHIGKAGIWAKPWDFDEAKDYSDDYS